MQLGHSITISPEQMREITARLRPHLPSNLKTIEPHPTGSGPHYVFEPPFTGREARPVPPHAFYEDPGLIPVSGSQDAAEHDLREKAQHVLDDVYERADGEWRNAAYVADLKDHLRDTPALWAAYQAAASDLETAYSYLSNPDAGREWHAAIFRLVAAQNQAKTTAAAFDARAELIAQTHRRHLYADRSPTSALTAAGYPETAKDWHIADADDYSRGHHFAWSSAVPLLETVSRLIEQQDSNVAKVARLAGEVASLPHPR
ncbi:hypothetical protein [Streptomyces sp. NPDC056069]|uniref:hypothetical protein n=1 Tax=Streptomyces sp. NPDC056069 TaxID=3345702 RepID=UPI0035E03961